MDGLALVLALNGLIANLHAESRIFGQECANTVRQKLALPLQVIDSHI